MSAEKFLLAAREECRRVGGHCVKCEYKAISDGGQPFCAIPADMSDRYIKQIAKKHDGKTGGAEEPTIIASEADVQRIADALMERMKAYFADDAQEEKTE